MCWRKNEFPFSSFWSLVTRFPLLSPPLSSHLCFHTVSTSDCVSLSSLHPALPLFSFRSVHSTVRGSDLNPWNFDTEMGAGVLFFCLFFRRKGPGKGLKYLHCDRWCMEMKKVTEYNGWPSIPPWEYMSMCFETEKRGWVRSLYILFSRLEVRRREKKAGESGWVAKRISNGIQGWCDPLPFSRSCFSSISSATQVISSASLSFLSFLWSGRRKSSSHILMSSPAAADSAVQLLFLLLDCETMLLWEKITIDFLFFSSLSLLTFLSPSSLCHDRLMLSAPPVNDVTLRDQVW